MFLWHRIDYQPGATELQKQDTHTTRRRTVAGPAANYALEWFRVNTPPGGTNAQAWSPTTTHRRVTESDDTADTSLEELTASRKVSHRWTSKTPTP